MEELFDVYLFWLANAIQKNLIKNKRFTLDKKIARWGRNMG